MSFVNNVRPDLAGNFPQIHPTAMIDPSAQIIGNVTIENNVLVGPLAVIRADERGPDGSTASIVIGKGAAVQDGVIIQCHGGQAIAIGARTSLHHGAAVHGTCDIGEDCFLAMRSSICSSNLGNIVWVGIGSVVMNATLDSHSYVPEGSVIRNRPDAWDLRLVSDTEIQQMKAALEASNRLREAYLKTQSPGGICR